MLVEAPPLGRERVLSSGLKAVVVPTAAAPVATLMVVYRIGSRNEAVGYTGSAHLLEHMLFKGTPANNRSNGRAFADIMNEIGADKNATTWLDRTNYFETVPLEFLDFAIALEADRMRNAFVADNDRRSEMTVVRNELERADNDPGRVLHSATVATAFREHPYHHPTIGWRSDVEGVSSERLRELYDTYYRPENATVIVVGGVDVERTFQTLEHAFGSVPRAGFEIPQVYTEEPAQAGERTVLVKRPGDTTMIEYGYHIPAAYGQTNVLTPAALAERAAADSGDNDYYALDVLGIVLGRGKTSRLSRALVDTGLALDITAWAWASRDPGLFEIVVQAGPDAVPANVRGAVETVVDAMIAHGPTMAEVERAQRQVAVSRAFARDGTSALAHRLGESEAAGSWRFDETYLERIAEVTPERVRAVAERYLHEDNRTVGILVPGTPKTHDVVAFEPIEAPKATVSEVAAATLDAPAAASGPTFASRIASGSAGHVNWKYVSTPSSQTAFVRMVFEAGPAALPAHPFVPEVLTEMLARGTRSHPRAEVEERLERAGARRSYGIDGASGSRNPLAFRASAACAIGDLPMLLETVAEELREPRFDPAELALVKNEIGGAIKMLRSETRFRSTQKFLELAYEAGDPNAVAGVDALLEDLEAIDVAALESFWSGILLRRAPLISAAGGLETGAFARLLEGSIGAVPFGGEFQRLAVASLPRPARFERADVALERKANVDITIGRASTLVRESPDYDAAHLANSILGQSTISSRLGVRVRDREGLTYGITSGFASPGRVPGPWRIAVSVNPANVDRAIASTRSVLAEYAAEGPSEREVVAARNSLVGQVRVSLATNGGVAAQLERMSYYGLGDDHVDTYRERLDSISRSAVAAAAAKYLGEGNLLIAAAGTFSA